MEGLIIRNTGSHYVALTDNGRQLPCKAKGNFRIKGLRTTNPVAVGDRVELREPDKNSDYAYITAVKPRRNYIIRRASNLSKEAHILAANLDQVILVVTLAQPVTSTTFVDRFLATAEAYGIPATIVINKTDLLEGDPEAIDLLEAVEYLYRSIGYGVVPVSARDGSGIDTLRDLLGGKTTLISGNSGVGKSTLINRLIPGLNLKTAPISEVHDTGMHTTTFSEMYPLPGGGWLIDTPGVKGFGTIDFDPRQVAHYFPEIFAISEGCRYNDCTHTHEPGCAVLEALRDNRIAESRYNSYLSILEDDGQGKYRKPF
ncbi:MAG: ribosome small subunit-dependent GTPase A [Clostridium sp.]|nr:ribosome small subunit-dependent GTPase A [Clostridium sp.]